ncbi:hypothetical protein [Pelobacter seleniigenes]|uniref:hypothetical protein n=1 Tax=Pelobacter seleniigenes TaxID=407188 RepID=UPI0004A706E5|nr:hypothetical protein [Pelobacter seleniigenes]
MKRIEFNGFIKFEDREVLWKVVAKKYGYFDIVFYSLLFPPLAYGVKITFFSKYGNLNWLLFMGAIFIAVIFLTKLDRIGRKKAEKDHIKNPPFLSGFITENGITIVDEKNQEEFPWPFFKGYKQSHDLLAVRAKKNWVFWGPYMFRSNEDWTDFKKLIIDNLKPI